VYADAVYDTKNIRKYLRNRDITSNIPVNKRNRKKPKKGRKFAKNKDYASVRGGVERSFAWLKTRYKKIQTRYEFKSENFIAFINFAIFISNFSILEVLR